MSKYCIVFNSLYLGEDQDQRCNKQFEKHRWEIGQTQKLALNLLGSGCECFSSNNWCSGNLNQAGADNGGRDTSNNQSDQGDENNQMMMVIKVIRVMTMLMMLMTTMEADETLQTTQCSSRLSAPDPLNRLLMTSSPQYLGNLSLSYYWDNTLMITIYIKWHLPRYLLTIFSYLITGTIPWWFNDIFPAISWRSYLILLPGQYLDDLMISSPQYLDDLFLRYCWDNTLMI